jgi:Mrp family chromosome partitioning ATPase
VESLEQYRQTALHLWRILRDSSVPVVVFTSANPGEGSSTTAVEVARALRDTLELRVLLVRIEPAPRGKTEVSGNPEDDHGADLLGLSNGRRLPDCVQEGPQGLPTITSETSNSRANKTARLQTAISRVIRDRSPDYNAVIIDAPALSESADTLAVLEVVRQVVLVVGAGETRHEVVQRVGADLADHHIDILGTVLNKRKWIIPDWFYRAFVS